MKNPWLQLNNLSAGTLKCDRKYIVNYNSNLVSKSLPGVAHRYYIETKYCPQPFLGNRNAPFYLLLGNPSRDIKSAKFLRDEITGIQKLRRNKWFRKRAIDNLKCNNKNYKTKIFWLDPAFMNYPSGIWWYDCFSSLAKEKGKSLVQLSKLFFVVELHAYHSFSTDGKFRPRSSEYNFQLVKNAIKKKKVILIARSIRNWFKAVKELETYPGCFFLNSNREIRLSKSTIPPACCSKIYSPI